MATKSTGKSKSGSTAKKTNTKGKASSSAKSSAKKKKDEKITYVGSGAKSKSPVDAANRQYIYTIGFIAAAVLFSCIAFIRGENIWAYLRGSFFAFAGVGFFVLIVLCFAMAVTVCVKKLAKSPTALIVSGLTLTLIIMSFIHVLVYDSADAPGFSGWASQLRECASLGWHVSEDGIKLNGGILGAVFGGGLMYLFGRIPAIVISVILMFVNILLIGVSAMNMFGLSVRQALSDGGEAYKQKAEQRKADREAQKLERDKLEREAAREKLAQKRDKERDETDYYSFDELGEINANAFSRDVPPTPKDGGEKYKRPILSMPLEIGDPVLTVPPAELDVQPASAIFRQPAVQPAAPQAEEEKADDADLVNNAANDAKNKSEQTKAALDSYVDDKVKTRSRKQYRLPPVECLAAPKFNSGEDYTNEMRTASQKLIETLRSFNVETSLVGVCRGPSVTRYELQLAPGIKISKITNLSKDIALNLAVDNVIVAPIPDKAAVGIEVPNKKRATVTLREIIVSPEFRSASSKLSVVLGKDIAGNVNCADLGKMPHLLIAGTTGSGKSVCLNCMIASILYNATPDEVKMILIDPKQVEFSVYNGIPHLLVPVISNPRKASGALSWAVAEMENRYKAFSECGVRDIKGFNKYCQTHSEYAPMPYIVIFIDELNDLMMISPKEVEDSICRLAQKARAAGMHLVVATQRPSVDVITGIIKANIPSRIALSVSSQVDSRTILDAIGAEKLLGNGDMLFNPVGIANPVRIQGAFLSDEEVEKVVDFVKNQDVGEYDQDIMDEIERQAAASMADNKKKGAAAADDAPVGDGDVFLSAVEVVVNAQMASTTLLQRKLKLGYARAARIMDELQERGYVGPSEGSKPRKVLVTPQQWLEIKASMSGGADTSNDVHSQV